MVSRGPEVDPPAPLTALLDPDEFRAHPMVRFTAEQMPIKAALTLSEAHIPPTPPDALPPWWTWFGGRPLARRSEEQSWPRNREGRPLTHVLQVDLESERYNLREALFARTGLPSGGILQLFHDLETYGNAEDRGGDAWQVRWIEKDALVDGEEDFVLQQVPGPVPEQGDEDHRDPMELTMLNTAVVATVPSLLDVSGGLSREEGERYERASEWLEMRTEQLNVLGVGTDVDDEMTPWDDDFEPLDPPSRLGGFGFVEENPDYRRELEAGLPIGQDDRHVLLIELNPAQLETPIDWFHGLRPVQVWIRASDLAAKRFDEVWCLIRTDA